MASVIERLERTLEREAPVWGVDPVPPERRHLSGFDIAVLWGDLSVGLLVLLTGALLVPALSLPRALAAIVIGTALGCVPLALVGLAGAREGVPGMVLFRPVLGRRGSYLPSVLNILQLAGWTGFELWAMSQVAARMSERLFGFSAPGLWLAVMAVVCTLLALGGPILVVRRWLERFGAWVVGAVGAVDHDPGAHRLGPGVPVAGPGNRRPAVLAGRRPGDRAAGLVAAARRRLHALRANAQGSGARHVRGLRGRQPVVLRAGSAAGPGSRAQRRVAGGAGAGHGRARRGVDRAAHPAGRRDRRGVRRHLLGGGIGPEPPGAALDSAARSWWSPWRAWRSPSG